MSTFINFDTSGYNDSLTLRQNLESSIQGNRVNITGTTDTIDWKYNDFVSAQTAYITALNDYKSALSTANQQININIDDNAKKYSSEIANNVQYGGVNLIQGSASYKDWECYDEFAMPYNRFYKENEGICKILLRNEREIFLYTPKNLSLNIEQTYTLSFEMKATDILDRVIINVKNFLKEDDNIDIINEVIHIPYDELSTEWKRYEYHFEVRENSIKSSVIFNLIKGNSDTTEFYLRKVKLQKGTIATEWSLAPEDVQNSISDFEDKLNEELGNTLNKISNLQAQIDGEVNSWFFEGEPTLNNTPANEWTTDELKQKHEGDTYTDITTYIDNEKTPTAGQSWRWCNVDDEYGTGWHWHKIADSDAVKALYEASKAQSTADGKSTTFITQPSNYSVGDLWILSTNTTINSKEYTKGTILTANKSNETFIESDWSENVRYTDDTAAKVAEEAAEAAAEAAAKAAEEAAEAQDRFNKWISDDYITKDEIPEIKTEFRNINKDNEEISHNCEKYKLKSSQEYTDYSDSYILYYNALSYIIFLYDEENYSGDIQITSISESDPELYDFINKQKNYYDKRTEILIKISDAADAFAKAYVDDIKIGGVNLLYGSKNLIGRTGYQDFKHSSYNGSVVTKTISVDRCYFETTSGTSKEKVFITLLSKDDSRFDTTKEYTFSVDITNTDSSTIALYIKLSKTQGTTNWQNIVINPNETKHIEFTGYVEQSQYLQLYVGAYYGANYNCKFYLSNAQLEYGNKATSWKPNDADIIEARENIIKGGMMVDFAIKDTTHNYQKFTPAKSLKSNTEYVFSIESINLKSGSITPSVISIAIFNNGLTTTRCMYNVPYKDRKLVYSFISPSSVTSSDIFLMYAGKSGECNGIGFTTYGIKLAEGNKYTPWEGSADEQKTLMMLNNAMHGTTETNGGLMLTNTIGMKGSSTDSNSITAGINGLNTTVSGMESDLRFWAGSKTWEDIQSAPFRVYNNGKVYGTHFYGYNSATIINSDNYSNYLTDSCIDLTKTGNMIYLDSSLIKENNNLYLSINLKFPDNIEDYIGTELTIINPHKIPINKCGYIMNPDYCTAYNAYDQSSYSILEKIELTGEYKEGICTSSVYVATYNSSSKNFTMKNKVKDSDYIGNYISYRPKFATMYYYGPTSSCSMGGITDGWQPKKIIQVFKLISTPYIYFVSESGVMGTKSVKEFGDIKTISGYNFQQYAVWCLKEEMLSLPASLTYR